MKRVLGAMRRAADDFGMLEAGDRIAVGVSGGKDSMLLLYALWLYKKYRKLDYELVAITVDLGFSDYDTQPLSAFMKELGVPYIVEKTDIGQIVFDVRREPNPCALCSKMRKGAFYRAAVREGCNKAAFGHHQEDLIETFLLSLLYEARLSTFSPVTYLSRCGVTLIRPFVYLSEKEIISQTKKLALPLSKNPCPVNGRTKRAEMGDLLRDLLKHNPRAKENIATALYGTDNYNLWDKVAKQKDGKAAQELEEKA